MAYTKEIVRQYVGHWVHCETVYGVYRGIVHRATRDGVILVQHVQLTDGPPMPPGDVQSGVFKAGEDQEIEQVQFFGPGLFLPYPGIFFMQPFPFVI